MAQGVESGRVTELIDQGIVTAKAFGATLSNLGSIGATIFKGLSGGQGNFLDGMVKTTQAVEDFLKSAQGQETLRALGETLRVVGDVARDVLLTALREFGPVIVQIAPAVQEFARSLGSTLVSAMEVAGPLLQGLASFLSENKELLGDLVPLVLGAVVAYKGFQVAQQVAAWVGGATTALGLFGKGADDAGKKVGGLTTKTGLLKGALGGLVFTAAIAGLADLQRATESADYKISDFDDTLQDLSGGIGQLASGDIGGIFSDIEAEWDQMTRHLQGNNHFEFNVNTGPAQAQVTQFMNALKGNVGTINIDGRTTDASQALADVVQAINAGRGEVLIDGKRTPVQTALDLVVAQINASGGMVEINGNYVPAGDALKMFLTAANASVGTVTIDGNTDPVTGKTTAAIRFANGSTGTVTLDGNPSLVNGKTVQAVRFADGSRGTITIDGNPDPATGRVNATVTYANGRTGRISVDANAASANNAIDWAARNRTSTITVRYVDSGGLVRQQNPNLPGSFGRAMGGPIEGFASGGAVRGPGTGMSDSILARAGRSAIRLSNGEHIVTAREVQAAGGQGAVYGIRKAMLDGVFRGAGTGAAIDSTPTFTPRVSTGERVIGRQTTNTFYVNIDASSVAEMQSVADFVSSRV